LQKRTTIVPRQPKETVVEIFKSLKDFNFFDNRGHILRLSESVWKDVENRLNGELSIK